HRPCQGICPSQSSTQRRTNSRASTASARCSQPRSAGVRQKGQCLRPIMGLQSVLSMRLTVHVLPISSFAFRHPLNGRCEAPLASVLSFGFSNPFRIFLLVAVAEGIEHSKGLLIFLQLFHEIVR